MTTPVSFRIALGPLLYYWPRTAVQQFYANVADSAADIVYLGETVCTRRHELRHGHWLEIAAMLREAGKQVVLSTPVLVESDSDLACLHRVCEQRDYLVEANEPGAVRRMQGRAFVAGPHLNAYHAGTLSWLAGVGATRCVPPLEMSADDLRALCAGRPADMSIECFVWGRMPLAFSARCFTARHHRLRKDSCEFRCLDYPDGLLASTGEGQPFLALNGIQTQSAHCLDLCPQVPEMIAMGVDTVRVSPQSSGTFEAIALLDGVRGAARQAGPSPVLPAGALPSNGYWHGRPGIAWEGVRP